MEGKSWLRRRKAEEIDSVRGLSSVVVKATHQSRWGIHKERSFKKVDFTSGWLHSSREQVCILFEQEDKILIKGKEDVLGGREMARRKGF